MNYPLSLRFKLIALAPQIFVEDHTGKTVCYVKQKMFRLREKVEVFEDSARKTLLSTIAADRILDWSARYTFRDATDTAFGSVGRRGMRSLWSAHYDVFQPGSQAPAFSIREANPFTKIVDGLIGGIPVIGMLSGIFFHPVYVASRPDGQVVMKLTKQAAFFEGRFKVERLADMTSTEELSVLLSFMMLTLLKRDRG